MSVVDDEHGPFADHPDDCAGCIAECVSIEERFQANMRERGIELVDVRTLSPEDQRRAEEDYERELLAGGYDEYADDYDPCPSMYDEEGNEL